MDKCKWTYSNIGLIDTDDFWKTECGRASMLIEGTPEDNKMKYCPYCGKLIEEIEPRE